MFLETHTVTDLNRPWQRSKQPYLAYLQNVAQIAVDSGPDHRNTIRTTLDNILH